MPKPEQYGGFRWLAETRGSAQAAIQDIRSHHPSDVQFAESPLFSQILAYYNYDWNQMKKAIEEATG